MKKFYLVLKAWSPQLPPHYPQNLVDNEKTPVFQALITKVIFSINWKLCKQN